MSGTIFIEQLKNSWRQIVYWGGGLAFLAMFIMAILQDVTLITQYQQLLERLPSAILGAFGLSDAAALATPEGFIGFAALTYGTILMAVFAVVAGLDVTANDEDEGILDVLLSLPIPRWRVIVERSLAYGVIIVAIALLEFVGIVIGTFFTPLEINLMPLFLGCIGLIPAGLILMAVTVFLTSLISHKIIATGLAAGFALVSYVLSIIGSAVTEGSFGRMLGRISVWTYFDSQTVIQEGLNPANVVGLLALTLVLLLASLYAFERRDIG